MSKSARKSSVQISISGKDITHDLAPYLISFTYNDKSSVEVDDINLTLEDRDDLFIDDWHPDLGEIIECRIICRNWVKPGDKLELYCGKFEIDEITLNGPPSTIQIKAVSMLNSKLRRELHNKPWEKVTLEEICQGITKANNMELVFDAEDVDIDRVEQTDQSDLSFISKLCSDYGYNIKIDGETLFIYAEEIYEAKDIAFNISRFEVESYQGNRQAHDLYKECKVQYYDPNKKGTHHAKVKHRDSYTKNLPQALQQSGDKNWQNNLPAALREQYGSKSKKPKPDKKKKKTYSTYTYLDQANINGTGKTLVIRAKVKSQAEAEKLARAALRQKNKSEQTLEFSSIGITTAIAGVVVETGDFGRYDGIYLINDTTHQINKGGGYTTSVRMHRVLGSWEQNGNA